MINSANAAASAAPAPTTTTTTTTTIAMPKVLSANIDLNSNLTKPTNGENIGENNNAKQKKQKKVNLDGLKSELAIDEHRITLTELCERFSTNIDTGLSPVAAKERLHRDGPNRITPPKATPEWLRLLQNLFSWFNLLLWVGALLCLAAYTLEVHTQEFPSQDNLYLGAALAIVVTISGLFSHYQQSKSENIMASFAGLIPKTCTVVRAGHQTKVPVETLVLGDLVELVAGDQVPADVRIITASGLKVDNSSLTGESEPQARGPVCSHPQQPLETRNLAFFSTNVVEGAGKGVVIRVGDGTSMGRIAVLASSLEARPTPLSTDIQHFITMITYVAVFFGLLFGAFAYFIVGFSLLNASILVISLIVAQVPEGLLPTLTVVLTLTAKRLASKNCLVKNLEAVETLGATSTICTDKTGTLTQNRMTVSHIWISGSGGGIFDADNLIAQGSGTKVDTEGAVWRSLTRVACLCSKAAFGEGQAGVPVLKREAFGDASEVAILKYFEMITGSVAAYRTRHPKVFEVPFNSVNKYSLTINQTPAKGGDTSGGGGAIGGYWLSMKGAPERILERCTTILVDGPSGGRREVALDEKARASFAAAYEALGGAGERVIGLAERHLPKESFPPGYPFSEGTDSDAAGKENYPITGLCFLGAISMIDPPRPNVPDAVAKCRSAGIKVIMVTGDHPITAAAIARSVGIISDDSEHHFSTPTPGCDSPSSTKSDDQKRFSLLAHFPQSIVISGGELAQMSEPELDSILRRYGEIVFARTSPQQKLAIVCAAQRTGEVVAVTGDGVNDSPALKRADIGIAMGVTGSAVSRQAADMILLDDNFSSIETGIEEGRVIFDNLKKSICYTLSSKVPEMSPYLLYFFLGIPLGLAPIYILCIDFGTDLIPAISLAYERAESDIMKRAPRNTKTQRLVTDRLISLSYGQLGMIEAAAGFFTYFVLMGENGFLPHRLLSIRRSWDSQAVDSLEDSYQQEWTFSQRKSLEYATNTAFFATVVLTKWAAVLVCKTRKLSLLQQGKNNVLTFSLVFELALVLFLTYTPGVNSSLNMYPLKALHWLCPLPFLVWMLVHCEVQKLVMRLNKRGWAEKEFYY